MFSPVRILKGFGVEARLIEGGPGPLQGAVHGRNAGIEDRGNLARREAEHIAQDQSRAAWREKLQRGDEGQAHAGVLHGNGFGIGRWSAQQAVGKGLQPGHLQAGHERSIGILEGLAHPGGKGAASRPSSASRQALVAMRYSQVLIDARAGSNRS